ncbi:TPA: hypothetical protein EYG59_20080 [Candidatus Poribacteria bacterium]|nr:hypothetical protein [Candidatus Poribacteria bacterium]
MNLQPINGENAIAWGAIEAGISVVTGYPGSPGTGTFNALAETAEVYGHQAEWCINERIALDIAAGVSQGGKRAFVCLKSVGMNVALDTLMVLNMTGVHAGLVILLGDDPGAWGSQNEQDTRFIAPMAEIPMLEPSTPEEGRGMIKWAFEFSELLCTVVIIRITRSFSLSESLLPPISVPEAKPSLPPDRGPMRWISGPSNTVVNHRQVHQKIQQATEQFSHLPFNKIEGSGPKGILASGFAYSKLTEALTGTDTSDLSILKLNALYPLPKGLLTQFLDQCQEILVLEEVDPYLEDAIKAVGYDTGHTPEILGKRTADVNWEGELFRWHIQQALDAYLPDFSPSKRYTEDEWEKEKPARKPYCAGCPYIEILTILRQVAEDLGQNPFLSADPGCAITAAHLLDTKLCMGSAIGTAAGLQKAEIEEPAIAIFGDSAFYHSGLNALIHARATGLNLLMIVLDNGGAVTTGSQSTPNNALSSSDNVGATVSIIDLASTCGVEFIWIIEENDDDEKMGGVFRQALTADAGLNMIVVQKSCKPIDE